MSPRHLRSILLIGVLAVLPACGARTLAETCGNCPTGDAQADVVVTPSDALLDAETFCGVSACPFSGYQCLTPCDECVCNGTEWSCTNVCAPDVGVADDADLNCPQVEPANGAPCGAPNLECAYFTACDGSDDVAFCENGAWMVGSGCSTPSLPCPTDEPADHSACTGTDTCTWSTDGCGTDDVGTCAPVASGGSEWSITPGSCADSCPSSQPDEGLPCRDEGESCNYDNGCGGITTETCEAGTWQPGSASVCNGVCPATEPTGGSTCPQTSATPCNYVVTTNSPCTDACFCTSGGVWECAPGPVCSTPDL